MKQLMGYIQKAEQHVTRPWYPFLIAALAFIDLFIFVIPTEAVMITSIMAVPKRWISLGLFTVIGSVMGCLVFALLIQHYGFPIVDFLSPGIADGTTWKDSERWMNQYGLLAVFGVTFLPIMIHPILAIAVLAHVSISGTILTILAAKLLKYGAYAWIASHSPKLLSKWFPESKTDR